MDISIVVPLLNEEESLEELAAWIDRVMAGNQLSYELIFIDDGSVDNSWQVVTDLVANSNKVRGIKFRRNYGKSAALNTGFQAARGKVVVTMDADLQDSPEEVPELFKMITEQKFDLVSGWKKKRYDNTFTKNIPSKVYNSVNRLISGIPLHDMNCGLKAYRSEVIKSIEVYGEMHRYIPVIAKAAGFNRIGEKPVQHQERKYGSSKFGLERFVNGFLDLLTITFVSRFGKKPMHFFGTLGLLFFIMGFGIASYLTMSKILFHTYKMTERPLFYFGLLAMIIGTQLFTTGFLAELVSRNSPDKNHYLIEAEL